MRPDEYARADATELARLIRSGEVSIGEVHAVARTCIERINIQLNAVVGDVFERPLEHRSDGPFPGVPFGIKDLLIGAAGIARESGSRLMRGQTAPIDTELMRRFRSAGLATLCRTSTPEFGLSFTTEPLAGGPTRNPWDPERTAGGSSGGAAALVAAGALPWAHANDAAGSIRIPAAYCGLVGLKPTRGLIAPGPEQDEPLFGLTSEFVVTRSVRDVGALLNVVAGSAPGDRYQVQADPGGYCTERPSARPRLRIGVSTASPFGTAVDPAAAAAAVQAARLLSEYGHHIEFTAPQVDPMQLTELLARFLSASAAATLTELSTASEGFSDLAERVESSTAALARHGVALTWPQIAEARGWQNEVSRHLAEFHHHVDVWLTPTTATTAFPLGALDGNVPGCTAEGWVDELLQRVPFTVLPNITGQPAISIPAGLSGGLPLGVQLIGPHGSEATLLGLAGEIEHAQGLGSALPPIHAGSLSVATSVWSPVESARVVGRQ